MADGGTIEQRITDLIGEEYSTNATYSGDLINAAINSVADLMSEDLLLKYSADPYNMTSSSGQAVEDVKLLKVTRIDANTNGIERECKFVDTVEFSEAGDSTSIYYATVYSPVYTLDNDTAATTLKILPAPGNGGQAAKIWDFLYVADSVDTTGVTQATLNTSYFLPSTAIHAVVLKSCINILQSYISNQVQDEEDIELMQMIQQQDYTTEIQRFVTEGQDTGGGE